MNLSRTELLIWSLGDNHLKIQYSTKMIQDIRNINILNKFNKGPPNLFKLILL